jgi:RNA polymerase sigma factor (sigma-70 family)
MSNSNAQRRLASWFLQWRLPLRKFLISRGAVPVSDVDDVAQEVFLRLMRYERAELVEHPQAYLYKMASNVSAEWALSARRRRPHDPEWLSLLVAGERAEDVAGEVALETEIQRALGTLTPGQQTVMRLQFFEGLSRVAIAERLGITERSVKRMLMKSYGKLREQLDMDLLREIPDGRE